MANKSASKKDIKQSEKRRVANKSRRTFVKTCVKNVEESIKIGNKEKAILALKTFEKQGMKAVTKGVFHIKTISRKISRLYSRVKVLASLKIFLDTAEISQIRSLNELGIIDGVTTNPSIIAKSGRNFQDVISEICSIIEGPVSAEVIATTRSEMLSEALELVKIAQNVCIKLPTTLEGIHACNALSNKGIMVNMTLCFSAQQALLVAKAGASFVSPFIGRLDDIGHDGLSLIAEIREIYNNYEFETEILAASARNSYHFTQCAKIGADVITIPPNLIESFIKHPLTDNGLEIFANDWKLTQK